MRTSAANGTSEPLGLRDIVPAEMSVVVEEVIVNGVPCFQFEAMVIPGDAISRNTIPGKRGPTYYSARRVRQYAAANNRIIEEMSAKGQKVTVYPRHAAALLDASLPMGWVDRYDVRPSKTRPGIEDVWYQATVPLTTEGRDAWMKLRTGLVKFSSLRTYPDDRFKTEAVNVGGRVVEEAVSLPIAGIDLVATQPGLPVEPIRILEEAVPVDSITPALEEPMSAPMPPQHPQGPMPAQANAQMQQQQQGAPQQGQQQGGTPQVPPQYANCPSCGADITHHVLAAHMQMERGQQQQQPAGQQQQPGQQQAPQQQQQQQQQGQPPARSAREEELVTRNAELEQQVAALTAAQEGTNVSGQQTQAPAVEGGSQETPEILALRAQLDALKAELASKNTLIEEAATLVRETRASQAVNAKVRDLVAGDKTMGTLMRPIIERAIEEQALSEPNAVEIAYYKMRAQQSELLAGRAASNSLLAGFGHVNVDGLAGTEEARSAAGTAGQNTADPSDRTSGRPKYTEAQQALRHSFGRMGDYAPLTHDSK